MTIRTCALGLLLTIGTATAMLGCSRGSRPADDAAAPPAPAAPSAATPGDAVTAPSAPAAASTATPGWNHADGAAVAAELAQKILSDPWLDQFIRTKQRNPKLMVSRIMVRAERDVINTVTIGEILERQLLACGRIDIIAGRSHETVRASSNDAAGSQAEMDALLTGSITQMPTAPDRPLPPTYTATIKGLDCVTRQMLFSVEVQHTTGGTPAKPADAMKR